MFAACTVYISFAAYPRPYTLAYIYHCRFMLSFSCQHSPTTEPTVFIQNIIYSYIFINSTICRLWKICQRQTHVIEPVVQTTESSANECEIHAPAYSHAHITHIVYCLQFINSIWLRYTVYSCIEEVFWSTGYTVRTDTHTKCNTRYFLIEHAEMSRERSYVYCNSFFFYKQKHLLVSLRSNTEYIKTPYIRKPQRHLFHSEYVSSIWPPCCR